MNARWRFSSGCRLQSVMMLDGRADGTDWGVKGARGVDAVAMLRAEVIRLAEIRCYRILRPPAVNQAARIIVAS